MRFLTLTLASLALLAPIASANAAPPVRAGVLQCQGGQNVGFVVGSVTNLECVFRSEGRRPEPYLAKVQRIGLDLGVISPELFTMMVLMALVTTAATSPLLNIIGVERDAPAPAGAVTAR
jgi:hypothetical protein